MPFVPLTASHFLQLLSPRGKERHMRLVACCSARLIYCLEYHTPVTFHLFVSRDNFLSFCALIQKRCHRHLSECSVEWVIVLLATEHAQVMFSDRRRRAASHNRTQPECSPAGWRLRQGTFLFRQEGALIGEDLMGSRLIMLVCWRLDGVLHFKLLDAE